MKTITTERLILRPFREEDYDDLYQEIESVQQRNEKENQKNEEAV